MSPITGRAGALLTDLGNLVGPQTGSQITTTGRRGEQPDHSRVGPGFGVEQMHPIRVSFSVPQTELGEIRRNQNNVVLAVNAYSLKGNVYMKTDFAHQ